MKLSHAAATDQGPVRARNEDAFGAHPPAGVFIVADGMGGHENGDVASQLAVRTLEEHYADLVPELEADEEQVAGARDRLLDGIRTANRRIYEQPLDGNRARRMGTTVVAAHFLGSFVIVGHAGDCRCYRLRAGNLELLTRDHSFVEEVKAGRIEFGDDHDKVLSSYSNIVTRAVGMDSDIEADMLVSDVQSGDLFLLCSDGLWGVVPESQIIECAVGSKDLSARCHDLVRAANEAGATDNITVLLVAVED